jgi:hypothetical protein
MKSLRLSPPIRRVNDEAQTATLVDDTKTECDGRLKEFFLNHKSLNSFDVLSLWTGEDVPIFGDRSALLLSVERVTAPFFGILKYGVQLMAYSNNSNGLYVWLRRRAKHKRTFAGLLDGTVGGCLPTGQTPFDCLVREADE